MIRSRRLFLASSLVIWLGLALACGGAGSKERPQVGLTGEPTTQAKSAEQQKDDELLRQDAKKKYEADLAKSATGSHSVQPPSAISSLTRSTVGRSA